MNPAELRSEVRHRQAECQRSWAAVAGSAGRLRTERDHLVARVNAALRIRNARPDCPDAERAVAEASAALERHDDLHGLT